VLIGFELVEICIFPLQFSEAMRIFEQRGKVVNRLWPFKNNGEKDNMSALIGAQVYERTHQ